MPYTVERPKTSQNTLKARIARKQKENATQRLVSKEKPLRFKLLVAFIVLGALGLLLLRLLQLQVFQHEALKQKANKDRSHTSVLYSRGRILDRNGVVLAQDTMQYDFYFHPSYLKEQTPAQIAKALSGVLKKPVSSLLELIDHPAKELSTITVARNLSSTVVDQIKALKVSILMKDGKTKEALLSADGRPRYHLSPLEGLDLVRKPVRQYPQGKLAAHMVGFVNDEGNSSSGVESSALTALRVDKNRLGLFPADANGNALDLVEQDLSPLMGIVASQDITLTLDSRLQFLAERTLADGLAKSKAKRGSVIMLEPKTGNVLAFASLPSFDPNIYFKESKEALGNWALSEVYPPGSTMKILTVACGLETGVIKPDSTILDTGRMDLGGWNIQNYDYAKHPHPGNIDLVYLFQHSSNIASAKIASWLPKNDYFKLLKGFGMGQRTGLEVPGESAGIFPKTPSWNLVTQHTMGYGYGIASTPLQMAAAVASIANKGVWMPPRLIASGIQLKHPKPRRVLKASTAKALTSLLEKSIAASEAMPANVPMLRVAGKTGTSNKPREGHKGYSNEKFTSFVGFFPANDPQLLIMVVVDSPTTAESWGSTVAAPIFRDIAIESAHYLGIRKR
jgi:cell division protein FtsI (penicillin-binding protein 3)